MAYDKNNIFAKILRGEIPCKKIYYYPIKLTPLFFILKKEKIINLIRKNQPTEINAGLIEFEFIDQKTNKVKILFDKNSLEFKGWKTKDVYSNNVSFTINNLKTNNQIIDNFLKSQKKRIFKRPFFQLFRLQKYENVNEELLALRFLQH